MLQPFQEPDRRSLSLMSFLKARRNDELKATSTKSVFQHLAQPARVAAEFELASAELLEALLVVAGDLGPPHGLTVLRGVSRLRKLVACLQDGNLSRHAASSS